MPFNVPQFIDVEDKIIGPLTAKQMGWLGIGGVILLICWNVLDTSAFIFSAIIVGAIFGGLAFFRPYNQPLIKFISSSVNFFFRPKIYVWKRNYVNIKPITRISGNKKEPAREQKKLDEKKLREISQILDQK